MHQIQRADFLRSAWPDLSQLRPALNEELSPAHCGAATAAPRRTGQLVAALGGSAKAGAGQRQVLVGLRQDASSRTVLWLHSPGDGARVDLVYRDLDGVELGRLSGFTVAPWGVRQVAPTRLGPPTHLALIGVPSPGTSWQGVISVDHQSGFAKQVKNMKAVPLPRIAMRE